MDGVLVFIFAIIMCIPVSRCAEYDATYMECARKGESQFGGHKPIKCEVIKEEPKK